MRTIVGLLVAALLLAPRLVQAADAKIETEDQKSLYALGVMMSHGLAVFDLKAEELEFVKRGLTDGVLARKLEVEEASLKQRVDKLAEARRKAQAETEKAAAAEFLGAAAKEKGAVKTDSGLIITEIVAGSGESPKATDTVKVHYHGTLRDGTVFDSSRDRGTPATFPLNRVIPCWTEGVQKMKPGGRSKLVCPSSIAYGDRGAPPKIKPGAALVFDVELLEVVQAPPAKAPEPAKAAPPKQP
jgi:FKBP-type peptidyl-prolyl cis-trans isomerase